MPTISPYMVIDHNHSLLDWVTLAADGWLRRLHAAIGSTHHNVTIHLSLLTNISHVIIVNAAAFRGDPMFVTHQSTVSNVTGGNLQSPVHSSPARDSLYSNTMTSIVPGSVYLTGAQAVSRSHCPVAAGLRFVHKGRQPRTDAHMLTGDRWVSLALELGWLLCCYWDQYT